MEMTRTAFGALIAVCLVGGASGAYIVTRDTPAAQATAQVAPQPTTEPTVESTEAEVTDPAAETPQAQAAASAAPSAAPATPRAKPQSVRASDAEPLTPRHRPETAPAARPEPARAPEPVHETRDTRTASASLEPVVPVPAAAPEPVTPPAPTIEELIVSADSVIGLQMETSITSERARVEDQIVAQVTRDVKVGERVAIPSGAKAYGEVTLVERGGRLKDRARLGVRFTSIVLADGSRVPIETDTIIREGSSPGGESSAKIGGGALGGAIIGGILGGAKGAIIGGSAGAGAGSAAVLAGGRNAATLPSGTPVTVRLEHPATVTVEK